jgi:thiamine phosphate synthase YjbQ (UPF0047 family)
MRTQIIRVRTGGREAIRDITNDCAEFAKTASAGGDGLLHVFVPPYATIPVIGGGLALGTWQSVALVDLNVDNPDRQVRLSFLG